MLTYHVIYCNWPIDRNVREYLQQWRRTAPCCRHRTRFSSDSRTGVLRRRSERRRPVILMSTASCEYRRKLALRSHPSTSARRIPSAASTDRLLYPTKPGRFNSYSSKLGNKLEYNLKYPGFSNCASVTVTVTTSNSDFPVGLGLRLGSAFDSYRRSSWNLAGRIGGHKPPDIPPGSEPPYQCQGRTKPPGHNPPVELEHNVRRRFLLQEMGSES